jgi:hypothetical protein
MQSSVLLLISVDDCRSAAQVARESEREIEVTKALVTSLSLARFHYLRASERASERERERERES